MKDPLQKEKTPSEILRVEPDAGKEAIDKALIEAIRRGVPPNVAMHARDALHEPGKRARLKMVQYNDKALVTLVPCALSEPDVLRPSSRGETARAWEEQFRKGFPDLNAAHSLAVLWYWWTLHEESRLGDMIEEAHKRGVKTDGLSRTALAKALSGGPCATGADGCGRIDCAWREDCSASAPPIEIMWESVIGYWSMLAATPAFLTSCGLEASDIEAPKKHMVDPLHHRLLDRAQFYGALAEEGNGMAANASAAARLYRDLEISLRNELHTARNLASAGIRTPRGKVCCGPLLLSRIGMLDSARRQIKEAHEKSPGNQSYAKLHDALSPYAMIALLITEGKAEQAIEAIERLSASARKSPEVRDFRAQALHMKGKHLASVGRSRESLETLAEAISITKDKKHRAAIAEEVVAIGHGAGSNVTKARRDDAISILEQSYAIVADSDKLRLMLAELVTQRGIDRFSEAQKQAARDETGVTREIFAVYESALLDLRRGEALGLKRAADNAKVADEIVADARQYVDLPDEVRRLVSKADRAREAGRLDDAISTLYEAWAIVPSKTQGVVDKKLASVLCQRGVRRANDACDALSKAMASHNMLVESFLSSCTRGYGQNCSHCGTYIFAGPSFTVQVKDGRTLTLCVSCAGQLQALNNGAPKPGGVAAEGLQAAYNDIMDAAEFDPSDAGVKENLAAVRKVLADLSINPVRKKTPKPKRAAAKAVSAAKPARPAVKPAAKSAGAGQTSSARSAPGPAAPAGRGATSKLAIASLVLGILSLVTLVSLFGALPALIMGQVALRRIKASGGGLRGRGLAIAGSVLACLSIAIFAITVILSLNGHGMR